MEFVKKHIITILCILSILLLALPLASVTTNTQVSIDSEFMDVDIPPVETKASFSGFQALGKSVFAYLLIIGPVLLIAMNYIEQLRKYKGLLAIAVPAVCIAALIIVLLSVKSFSVSASTDVSSLEVKVTWGIGAFLLLASHGATALAGAVTYHDFKMNKEGLAKLKDSAGELLDSAQQKVSGLMQERTHSPEAAASVKNEAAAPASAPQPVKKAPVAVKRVDEVLALIEKLAGMKQAGILTEEEFSAKKKQLLEEI